MIDHDNLFYIFEKYVGIGGSAQRLIRSYFCDRTQRVQIDGIMSDFASLYCGVPQGSVLGPMTIYLYLLPLGAILRHHNIGYHIYADDTVVVVYPLSCPLIVGGSPMFPLVVHQPASPSIWPTVQSLRRGLSTNPGVTMWCVCGCS